jgi:hypothetical protein
MWGCFTFALVAAPLFAFLLIGDALGDCVPDTPCKHGFLSQVLVPTLAVATVVGIAVWAGIKAARRRDS